MLKPKVIVLEKLGTPNHPGNADHFQRELERILGEQWDQGYEFGGYLEKWLEGHYDRNPPRYFVVLNPRDTNQATSRATKSKPTE